MAVPMESPQPTTYRCSACHALNRLKEGRGRTPICGRCKERLDTTGAPQVVSAEDLEELKSKSPVPVLVDFWAPWCPPCKMAAPILDRVAKANAGRLITVKVNGELTNHATNLSDTQGAIALQSEGTPIQYRDIKLTPLK